MTLPTSTCRSWSAPSGSVHGDHRLEVADEAVQAHELAVHHHVDVGVLDDPRDPVGEHVARRVEVRSREVDAAEVAAEVRLALDEVDELAGVGELESGRDAGDAAADDERVGAHVDGAAAPAARGARPA